MYKDNYPLNLMLELDFQPQVNLRGVEQNFDKVLTEYFNDEKCFLNDREKTVILLRYKEQKTLAEIGREFGITRERIRQIESRALRKLKYLLRSKSSVLFFDYDDYAQMQQQIQNKREQLSNTIENLTDLLSQVKWLIDNKEEVTVAEAERILLQHEETKNDLVGKYTEIVDLDLSVRSINCLRRAGFKTVEELANLTVEKLMKIRNLGRKSLKEILEKLEELGIKIEEE